MKKDTTITSREVPTETSRSHEQKATKRFLRGPIPIMDLALASRLGGNALTVLLLVHHRAALTKSRTVTLPSVLVAEFGIRRDAKARALHALQEASLIVVERRPGRTALVTVLDHPQFNPSELFSKSPVRSTD